MDRIKNPFSPGAGWPPPALIGRDEVMENARVLLGRTLLQRHEKSMMLTGLRGVGKTVLLNKIERMAMEQGYKTIIFEVQDVHASSELVIRRLDENFFRVRYDRLAESEKRFMRAMAELNSTEFRCAEIAPLLGMKPTAITPTRANLIRKGMIHSPRHGIIDYSVPLFDEFLRRVIPQLPERK